MIRVTIEMVPHGDEHRAYPLALMEIENEGTLTLRDSKRGDYSARLSRIDRKGRGLRGSHHGVWNREVKIFNFPRARLTVYDLLYRVLHEAVGARNPAARETVVVRKAV